MQNSMLLFRDSLYVDTLLYKCLYDVSVAFVSRIMQGCPLVRALSIDVCDLELFLRRVEQVHHLLHVAFLGREQEVLIVLFLKLIVVCPWLCLGFSCLTPRIEVSFCVVA